MSDMYSDVREHLRQQHFANTQEVHGKSRFCPARYEWNENPETGQEKGFRIWVVLFIAAVMVFSCYLYGNRDVKKGASMAWHDITVQVEKLEEEKPVVKQTMGYVHKAYDEVLEFSRTYINLGD